MVGSTKYSRFKTKPYKHQLECLEKYGDREYFALLAEMGTGKTWIVINNVAFLWSDDKCGGLMVFAPNGVHLNWVVRELPKHMPDFVNYQSHAWRGASTKREREAFETFLQPCEALKVFTMNWEALATKKGFEAAERFCETTSNVMIACDEADAIKNPSARRTKAIMKLRSLSAYRRIMTGTPITNSPFDAFAQFSFLSSKILGTTSFYSFKAEYAEMLKPGNPLLNRISAGKRGIPQIVARGAGGVPKYRNLDKLSRLIEPHSFRVLKKDCLDLPDKVYKTFYFDLTPEQSAIYDEVKEECRLVFNSQLSTFNTLVSLGKLSQVTSGYFLHPDSDEPVKIGGKNPKLELLLERVESQIASGAKVIIWARYRAEIADIVGALKDYNVVQYHGGTSEKERHEAIESFENGDAQVFVSNQQSGGTGLTLVAANVVIYYSNSFSLRDRLQSEDRAHRIGQKKSVLYINLAASGTIDEKIIQTLEQKQDIAEAVVGVGSAFLE